MNKATARRTRTRKHALSLTASCRQPYGLYQGKPQTSLLMQPDCWQISGSVGTSQAYVQGTLRAQPRHPCLSGRVSGRRIRETCSTIAAGCEDSGPPSYRVRDCVKRPALLINPSTPIKPLPASGLIGGGATLPAPAELVRSGRQQTRAQTSGLDPCTLSPATLCAQEWQHPSSAVSFHLDINLFDVDTKQLVRPSVKVTLRRSIGPRWPVSREPPCAGSQAPYHLAGALPCPRTIL